MPNEYTQIEAWVAQRLQLLGLISGNFGEDFRAEDLAGKDLRGKDFTGANLRLANLADADLREAKLSFTTLHMADLSRADLRGANLVGADLLDAHLPLSNLEGANLTAARLSGADLTGADLKRAFLGQAELINCNVERASLAQTYLHSVDARDANFRSTIIVKSNLSWSKFTRADFQSAKVRTCGLVGASLNDANLRKADLTDSDLLHSSMIGTDLTGAILTGARVFGASVWNVRGEPSRQSGLVVTPPDESPITVDDLELAQFIYLILSNEKLRGVIDTITSKAVLILGRFGKRMPIINGIRQALRRRGYAPIVCDFKVSTGKNTSDTVKLLAQMARYIVVDVTDPQSAPYEIGLISMLNLKSTPVVPLIQGDQEPFAMLEDVLRQDWCVRLCRYNDLKHLAATFDTNVIDASEAKRGQLRKHSGALT